MNSSETTVVFISKKYLDLKFHKQLEVTGLILCEAQQLLLSELKEPLVDNESHSLFHPRILQSKNNNPIQVISIAPERLGEYLNFSGKKKKKHKKRKNH